MNHGQPAFGFHAAGRRIRDHNRFWASSIPERHDGHHGGHTGIPYVATCSPLSLDLYEKVKKAKTIEGTRFIHVHTTPARPDGSSPSAIPLNSAMAVETGLVVLYEIEDNIFRLTSASESLARKGGNLQACCESTSNPRAGSKP